VSFGLRELDLEYIVSVIRGFDEIEKASIFGSRAKGNYKPGSDIDIAVYGENINLDILSKLNSILEEKVLCRTFLT